MHHERRRMIRFLAGAIAATLAAGVWAGPEETLKRGAYLVTVGR